MLAVAICVSPGLILAQTGAASQAPANAAAATQSAEPKPSFDVLELRVLGNTQLSEIDIDRAIYGYLGKRKTLDDVEAARLALEKLYHDRGYGTVFVDIPEQSVDEGIVRLRVTESKLDQVRITRAKYFSNRQIRDALPEATQGKVPQLQVLQQEINQVNAVSADRSVTPILKAGRAPGTVDLSLRVDERLPLHASFEMNNQYTVDTSPLRAIVSLGYDDLFDRFDSIAAQYQTSPQNRSQVDVWLGSYTTHLPFDGSRLSLYYFRSNSLVASASTDATSLTVLGRGTVIGTRLITPLSSGESSLQTLTVGVDRKHFLQNVNSSQAQGGGTGGLTTPITYANLSLGYSGGWRGTEHQFTASLTGNFGIRGAPNDTTEFEDKRFQARPNYAYLRSDESMSWTLPAHLNLLLKTGFQYAYEPIISNEQYSIAGIDGVRGYLEAEELGDRGIKGTAQLGTSQWKLPRGVLALDGFAFFDYGRMSVIDPLPSEVSNVTLRSSGLGFDFASTQHFTGTFSWAYPLVPAIRTRRGDSRYLFDVRATW